MRTDPPIRATETPSLASLELDALAAALLVYRGTLTDDERARADRFVFERDRVRFTAGRAQLREHLGAWLGIAPPEVPIAVEGNGKPFVRGREDLLFNLSHSEGQGLLALARRTHGPRERLGVDLEAKRPLRDLSGLARHVFSSRERAQLDATPAEGRPEVFYEVWTKKEAVIKALGDGVAYGLGRFSVPLLGEPLVFEDPDEDPDEWMVEALSAGPGFAAALARRIPKS